MKGVIYKMKDLDYLQSLKNRMTEYHSYTVSNQVVLQEYWDEYKRLETDKERIEKYRKLFGELIHD